LPRGLGDDPLTRKRPSSSNATNDAINKSSPVAVAPQTSHNDVFFRRRSEDTRQVSASAQKQAANETPEIAEVNDIVRIAEATLASKPAFVEPPHPAADEPVIVVQTPPPLAEEPGAPQTEASKEAQPEPRKSGGFFRRLFRRHAE
jgi:hypothetical protein